MHICIQPSVFFLALLHSVITRELGASSGFPPSLGRRTDLVTLGVIGGRPGKAHKRALYGIPVVVVSYHMCRTRCCPFFPGAVPPWSNMEGYFRSTTDGAWGTAGGPQVNDLSTFPPDLGPMSEPPPQSGLVTIGAVPWVVNYNVPLQEVDLQEGTPARIMENWKAYEVDEQRTANVLYRNGLYGMTGSASRDVVQQSLQVEEAWERSAPKHFPVMISLWQPQ